MSIFNFQIGTKEVFYSISFFLKMLATFCLLILFVFNIFGLQDILSNGSGDPEMTIVFRDDIFLYRSETKMENWGNAGLIEEDLVVDGEYIYLLPGAQEVFLHFMDKYCIEVTSSSTIETTKKILMVLCDGCDLSNVWFYGDQQGGDIEEYENRLKLRNCLERDWRRVFHIIADEVSIALRDKMDCKIDLRGRTLIEIFPPNPYEILFQEPGVMRYLLYYMNVVENSLYPMKWVLEYPFKDWMKDHIFA